jgi:hypothetical protein
VRDDGTFAGGVFAMKKKLSSITFWLMVFFAIIVVEAYSALV